MVTIVFVGEKKALFLPLIVDIYMLAKQLCTVILFLMGNYKLYYLSFWSNKVVS